MAYFLDLFSPETYDAFGQSDRSVSGFRISQKGMASRIRPGDRFLCYMTKLSRWVGVLEILSDQYEDDTPILYEQDDPFVVRFKVRPAIWLDRDFAVPIYEPEVWNALSFTKSHAIGTPGWTGSIRRSLAQLPDADGKFIEGVLQQQASGGKRYPVDQKEWERLLTHRVRTAGKTVSVTVPEDPAPEDQPSVGEGKAEVRESIKIQALLAGIGARMGFKIWLPKNDRAAVLAEWKGDVQPVLNVLPLNYDEITLKTIEQIDVLWLKGRAIMRAFEVEHTTAIYSGILRMADLLALQPNMDIRLHIVAPEERKEKVFQEIRRPVFSLLDKGPLSESCTFVSYDSLHEMAKLKHLAFLSHEVLDEYAEPAE